MSTRSRDFMFYVPTVCQLPDLYRVRITCNRGFFLVLCTSSFMFTSASRGTHKCESTYRFSAYMDETIKDEPRLWRYHTNKGGRKGAAYYSLMSDNFTETFMHHYTAFLMESYLLSNGANVGNG